MPKAGAHVKALGLFEGGVRRNLRPDLILQVLIGTRRRLGAHQRQFIAHISDPDDQACRILGCLPGQLRIHTARQGDDTIVGKDLHRQRVQESVAPQALFAVW